VAMSTEAKLPKMINAENPRVAQKPQGSGLEPEADCSGVNVIVAGKPAGRPAFLPEGRGGEESRPYNHVYITRKPRPTGGELHMS
jgi:hypothetical protein